jgi:osmotically-inducible protein OsmY
MATSPDDAAIKKSVEDNLTKAGVRGVTVAVKDKVVTLTGTVPAADLPKAVQAANEATPKPTKVENQLTKS